MKGLIKKDLFLVLRNFKTLVGIFIVFIIISLTEGSDITFILPFLCIMLFFSTFSYDEYNKWDGYTCSLPVSRKNIVKSKYLAALIVLVFSTLLSFLVMGGIAYVQGKFDFEEIGSAMVGSISAVLLIQIVMYPLIYKYGVEKGRIALFAISFGLATLLGLLFSKVRWQEVIPVSILKSFMDYAYVIIPILLLFLLWGSFRLSVRIYSKKEF